MDPVARKVSLEEMNCFIEDLVLFLFRPNNIVHSPSAKRGGIQRLFSHQFGHCIELECRNFPMLPMENQFQELVNLCDANKPYVVEFCILNAARLYFEDRPKLWDTYVTFLAFVGNACIYFGRKEIPFMIDDTIMHAAAALVAREEDIINLGGFRTFYMYCSAIVADPERQKAKKISGAGNRTSIEQASQRAIEDYHRETFE